MKRGPPNLLALYIEMTRTVPPPLWHARQWKDRAEKTREAIAGRGRVRLLMSKTFIKVSDEA